MTPQSRSRVPLRTLADGFEAARARFQLAAGSADRDGAFIALFDVVAWAGAIGDWLKDSSKATNPTIPPLLLGLVYVRNRVIHLGADALFQGTFLMPSVYGGTPFGIAPFAGGYAVSEARKWKLSSS